jgi:hypothetical protein
MWDLRRGQHRPTTARPTPTLGKTYERVGRERERERAAAGFYNARDDLLNKQ